MVQLIAYTQGDDNPIYLDLGATSIKANYSALEVQDITKRQSEYTHNFKIPFTEINNDFFAHYYEVNISDGSFNSSLKSKLDIVIDSSLAFEGYLQLMSVDKLKETYEVLAFGDIANLAKEMGEDNLNKDGFLDKYNHILSEANIVDSWDADIDYSGAEPNGAQILYPIADYGEGYTDTTNPLGAIKLKDLKPSIQIKAVVDELLSDAGYSYTSAFMATDFYTKQYMTLGGGKEGAITEFVDGFKVGLSSNQSITSTGNYVVDLDAETGGDGFFDANGNWNGGATSPNYSVPFTGVYKFKLRLKYTYTAADQFEASLRLKITGGTTDQDIYLLSIPNSITENTIDIETPTGLELESGETLTIELEMYSSSTLNLNIKSDGTYFRLLEAPNNVVGGTVTISEQMPEIKKVDFLRSIFARFNLFVDSDKNNPKKLLIEPVKDYYDSGISKDWTGKIDLSKGVTIAPLSRYRKDELILKDLDSEDYLAAHWKAQTGNNYNYFRREFNDDFASGKLEYKSIFSPFTAQKTPTVGLYIAKIFKDNNGVPEFVETAPKIFYYSGKQQLGAGQNYYIEATIGSQTSKTEYPFCHHYSKADLTASGAVESTDIDIRFKSDSTYDFADLVQTQTSSDVYNQYWKGYIDELYHSDARMMTANFLLSPEDIATMKYNDKIFIRDSYWRINKISGYAMGTNTSTKVELIKVIDISVSDYCDQTISSYNLDGTTNWVDVSGGSVTVTEECCLAEGLTYSKDGCFWNTPTGEPDDTNPTKYITIKGEGNTTGGISLEILGNFNNIE